MSELDSSDGSLRFDKPGDPGQRWDVLIAPNTEVAGGNPAISSDCGRFRDDQPHATCGAAPQMD